MSDILEDQKIHYIVKDYRRMYNEYHTMVKALKEYKELLNKRDNRIRDLERQVENLKNQIPTEPPVVKIPKEVKGLLNDAEAQVHATINKLEKRIAALTRTDESLQKIHDLIYNQ